MSFARSLAILLVLGLVGLVGYQIGISQQIATAAPGVAPLAPVAYGYYPWHFGFGFFGLLFPLFFLFLFFGLLRAAFGGGHRWGGGYKYGRWGRMEEMHEELHRAKTDRPSGGASSGPSGTAT